MSTVARKRRRSTYTRRTATSRFCSRKDYDRLRRNRNRENGETRRFRNKVLSRRRGANFRKHVGTIVNKSRLKKLIKSVVRKCDAEFYGVDPDKNRAPISVLAAQRVHAEADAFLDKLLTDISRASINRQAGAVKSDRGTMLLQRDIESVVKRN